MNFITGRLAANEVGVTYEGVVYDRWLTVQLADNQTLRIFDPGLDDEPMSSTLQVEEDYTFLLAPLLFGGLATIVPHTEIASPIVISDPKKVCQGKIVDAHWKAEVGAYRFARLGLYKQEWVLVVTSLGVILLSQKGDIRTSVSVGDVLQWKTSRWDLYGVE